MNTFRPALLIVIFAIALSRAVTQLGLKPVDASSGNASLGVTMLQRLSGDAVGDDLALWYLQTT